MFIPTDIHEVSPYNYLNYDTPSYYLITETSENTFSKMLSILII